MKLLSLLLIFFVSTVFSASYTFQGTCISQIADNNYAYCVTVSNGTTTFKMLVPSSYESFVSGSTIGDPIVFNLPEISAEMDVTCLALKSLVTFTEASTLPAARVPFIIRCIFPYIDSTIWVENMNTGDTAFYILGLNDPFLPFNDWWAQYLATWNSIS